MFLFSRRQVNNSRNDDPRSYVRCALESTFYARLASRLPWDTALAFPLGFEINRGRS